MDARSFLGDVEQHGAFEETEEMYIHFYTMIYPATPSTLSIYWYKNTNENFEIFEDVQRIFQKMKEFNLCTTYTGDVFCIKNERLFVEQLLLLGVEPKESCSLHLINGMVKEVHKGSTSFVSIFNDVFDICFHAYDICQSFSSYDKDTPLRLFDKKDRLSIPCKEKESVTFSDKHVMIIDFFDHQLVTTFIGLKTIVYSIFDSIIDNRTLNKWFTTLVQKQEYETAVKTIMNIQQYQSKNPYTTESKKDLTSPLYEDSSEEEEKWETRSVTPTDWIRIFCDLYLQPYHGSDILLSEVYHEYTIASGWTTTPTVSMATFIKTLRSFDRFPIKRRAKGMMIIGYRSLVSYQMQLQEDVKNGQESSRNLLRYMPLKKIHDRIYHRQEEIKAINIPYAREICILLHETSTPLTSTVASQFCAIPALKDALELYAKYIEEMVSKPLQMDFTRECEAFREVSENCVLYFPFRHSYITELPELLKMKEYQESRTLQYDIIPSDSWKEQFSSVPPEMESQE